MAADLHIHVVTEEVSEADFQDFFCSIAGSKYFSLHRACSVQNDLDRMMEAHKKFSDLPGVNIGEVSWLKAAVFGDDDAFIPKPCEVIAELVPSGERAVLTDTLRDKIVAAFDHANTTGYTIANAEEVREFLDQHIGRQIITISW